MNELFVTNVIAVVGFLDFNLKAEFRLGRHSRPLLGDLEIKIVDFDMSNDIIIVT